MRGNKRESEQVKGQMGKTAMGDGEQPARCIVSPQKTIYTTRTRIHTCTHAAALAAACYQYCFLRW